jgi:hypothetical protein
LAASPTGDHRRPGEQHCIVIEKNRPGEGEPIMAFAAMSQFKFGYGIEGTVHVVIESKTP